MKEWEDLIQISKEYLEAYEKVLDLGRDNENLNESQRKIVGLLTTFKHNNAGSVKNALRWLEDSKEKAE